MGGTGGGSWPRAVTAELAGATLAGAHLLLARAPATMEGPREFLSGKARLRFTPAARTSFLLLRLNDAALRTLHECQRLQVRPVIAFQGQRGYLRLPGPGWSCLFSFVVSQCGQQGTGSGLDLVYERLGRYGPNTLHCLGSLKERLTIWAGMDSISAPPSAQGHNLSQDARNPESWQNTDYSEGYVVLQAQVAQEEARPETARSFKVGPSLKSREASAFTYRFPCQVSDPLASNPEQSLPGSSSEHMAQWEVRNQPYLSDREPDQLLPSPAKHKRLDKKCPASVATKELEEKRLRTVPLSPSPLHGLSTQDFQERENWEQEDKDEDTDSSLENSLSIQEASDPSPDEVPDYLLQYRTIHSAEQQQAYEQDFETDYAEYRILHARVEAASQKFTELGAQIKRIPRGTPEHKVLEDKIVQEYKKFQKQCPGYREEKHRCEYLHQKLSHIKALILEFEEKNRGS